MQPFDTLSIILSFIFGAVIGSFLNVVSLRFNTGKSINGRSKCMTCGETLTWRELFPILSFLVQKGACKKCKSKISWQYPLIEFIAGAVFVLIFITFPPITALVGIKTIIYLLATSLLIVIAVYDIKHQIIPNDFVYLFILLSLVNLCVGGDSWLHVPSVWAFAAGPLLTLPFSILSLVSRGQLMGWGDSKLMLGIGWFLGISAGINAVVLAFWIAAAVSLIYMLVVLKQFKAKTQVPFGPYLILGMYLVLIFKIQAIDLYMLREIITVLIDKAMFVI